MGKATQDLIKEHEAIIHVLEIVDKMMASDTKKDIGKIEYYKELIYFLKIFADKCHHGKEENYLFKELVINHLHKNDGLIKVMLEEHVEGRKYIALMDEALTAEDLTKFNANAINYSQLLKKHIEKENNVLFPLADELLDEKRQNELFEKFEQYEETVIGHGIHEKLHTMIHRWAEQFK